jgi:hypothetical protein
MPKSLPKNLGGLGSRFWKEIKKKTKLSKDEDLEKHLGKLESGLANTSAPPTIEECDSLKKHALKAAISAGKVRQKNKQDIVIAFCEAVIEEFDLDKRGMAAAIQKEWVDAQGRAGHAEGPEISADIFSLANSKFPGNKALKAFISDKAFIMFCPEGQKPVKDPELARIQAEMKKQVEKLKKCYEELGKLSKVKKMPANMVEKVKAVYDRVEDLLAPADEGNITGLSATWRNRIKELYSAQFEKFKKNPVWTVGALVNVAVNNEYMAFDKNVRLVEKL